MKPVEQLAERFQQLKTERSNRDAEFRDIATFVRPARDKFMTQDVRGPERRAELDPEVYDSTAIRGQENFAGGLYGMMTNPANQWLSMEMEDEPLNQIDDVKQWTSAVSKILLRSFRPSVSDFYNQVPDMYADTASFGTGIFFSERIPGESRIHDRTFSLDDCWLDTDGYGRVNAVYRRFFGTPGQLAGMFGQDKLSKKTQEMVAKRDQTKIFMLHVVYPNEEWQPGRELMVANKPFTSVYFELQEKAIARTSGYDEFPYQANRWAVSGGDKYGRGLGWVNLPDIKMLNIAVRDLIIQGNKAATPPILAADEDQVSALLPIPNGITYGAISPQGKKLVSYLENPSGIPISLQLVEAWREQIREGFHFSLMQLVSRTGMTATEVLERNEEKLRLLGPHFGRNQTEFLTPHVGRRFRMLARAGQIPPPPDAIRGATLQPVYTSPMAQAQKAADASNTLRFIGGVQAVREIDPSVGDKVNGDRAVEVLQEGWQVPADLLNSDEETQRRRQARQQQEQLAVGLEAGAQGADIANKLGINAPVDGAS